MLTDRLFLIAVILISAGTGALSAYLLWRRKAGRRMRITLNGINLLRAGDFSNRLPLTGQSETDAIVDLFNSMMTALKEERRALREKNHFLDLLINVSPMGIIILDTDGKIDFGNRAAEGFLGMSPADEFHGLSLDGIKNGLGAVLADLADGEMKVVRLNDSMIYRCHRLSFMEKGVKHPFLLIEKLTDEVMKAERKAYEKVIRLMAHEINNSIAGIISMIETASIAVDDEELSEALLSCGARCRDMGVFISKFAAAVKLPDPVFSSVELNSLLKVWSRRLESLCAVYNTEFRMVIPEKSFYARIDSVLIEQAVINIVKNAAESAGPGGIVVVTLSESGPTLIISDNGEGITPEAAGSLFTPFFSTKEKGHGLGLTLVSEILNAHGCRFSLQTEKDGLTRFKIHFQ